MANKIGVLDPEQTPSDKPKYFIKRRISNQLVASGYARRVSRWLIAMLRITYAHALDNVIRADSGELKAEGPPGCSLAVYPARDYSTAPRPFGYAQDWDRFPLNA